MELNRKRNFDTLKHHMRRVRNFFEDLKHQSPTFNSMLFSFKCAAIGYAVGLVFLRRVYVPTVLGLGYGIGSSLKIAPKVKSVQSP